MLFVSMELFKPTKGSFLSQLQTWDLLKKKKVLLLCQSSSQFLAALVFTKGLTADGVVNLTLET